MFFRKTILLFFLFISLLTATQAQERELWMDYERMQVILDKHIDEVKGETGNWELRHHEQVLFVMCDSTNNRMRIFTPIIEEAHLKKGELEAMLNANFHSALDAKYSLYEGFVLSVYTHPLKELTEAQLLSAMGQVINLSLIHI